MLTNWKHFRKLNIFHKWEYSEQDHLLLFFKRAKPPPHRLGQGTDRGRQIEFVTKHVECFRKASHLNLNPESQADIRVATNEQS